MSQPMVSVEGVQKWFGENHVLRGIDLEVEAGEVFCLIGPSGSGKSTMLRCINHLESIDDGSITVDGELVGYRMAGGRLHALRDSQICHQRQDIGMVFQRFNLFPHMTVLQNVMKAPMLVRKESRMVAEARGVRLLDQMGLLDHKGHYPAQLSGGQQQRVAIARALAMEPKLMLFDEPTSALDPELVGEVLDAMRELAATGMTMVVVTHEIGFAREVGDHVLLMADGVVVESGRPKEMLVNPTHERTKRFLSAILS